MPDLPQDQEARDRVAGELRRTLFVEAGAGTGKTTALVSRIVALVKSGVPITRVAAITFTDKAAAELAERVRRELERAARRDKGYANLSDAECARCAAALPDLDRAAIQTLHSFAQRILSLYPLEAGLPPQLRVTDDVEGEIAFQERWRQFKEELLDDPSLQRPLVRAFTLGLKPGDLEVIGKAFHTNWERLAGVTLPTEAEPDPASVVFPDALDEAREALGEKQTPAAIAELARLQPWADQLRDGVARIRAAESVEERESAEADLLRLAAAVPRPKGNVGKGVMSALGERHREWLDAARRAYLGAILPRIRQFALDYAAERRSEGRLGFQDLLVLGVELLRTNDAARKALHERFQRILIDEFQDTDPLQADLASLLAGDPAKPSERWAEARTEAGRLFFVGDPKQSIYRFRRADIDLYRQARSAFDSETLALSTNFRSTRTILEWVNGVFGVMFTLDAPGGAAQAEWMSLDPGPKAATGAPVQLVGRKMEGANAAAIRAEEAGCIANCVAAAQRENWLAREAGTRFADITILLPTRTNSAAIERALGDLSIPFRVESRSLVYGTQDVRDLTNMLAAIDDPTDDVAIVAALRSPGFACRDDELLEYVRAGGRWNYLREAPEPSPQRVRDGLAGLHMLHTKRWQMSTGALVETVIGSRHLLELAMASQRPREAWRRFRFVAEQARQLEESGTLPTLRQFVEWLRQQAVARARVNEGIASEPDDDAVRIMTVHAAKGLEFEIVLLAGLGTRGNQQGPHVVWPARIAEGGTVEVRVGPEKSRVESSGFKDANEREKEHDRLERVRLLYVAATRAKQRLVVSVFRPAAKEEHEERHAKGTCLAAECIEEAAISGMADGVWEWYDPPAGDEHAREAQAPATDSAEARAAWIAERVEVLRRTSRAPVLAATAIAHEGETQEEKAPPDDEEQPWRKGRAGTSIGRAVHAVLQTIDLETGAGVENAAEAQAVAEGIPAEAARVARLAANALELGAVREAVASGRYWREVYVGTEIEGATVEGFVDLLYEGASGLVVVDYKTDSVATDAQVDQALNRYRLQGAAYALAMEGAVGRPVAEVRFVFTEPKRDEPIPDLETAKQAVRAMIPKVLAARGAGATRPNGA